MRRRLQLALQCPQVAELLLNLEEFFLQANTYRSARLQAAAAQGHELANSFRENPKCCA
jgi:hypothetical protein